MFTFNYLKKNLKKNFSNFQVIKLALLSDSSSQLLHQVIKGYGYECHINFEIYESDYNQIDLQVFDTSSDLYSFNPDFIFINKSSEHLLKYFYSLDINEKQNFSLTESGLINQYCQVISENLNSKIIINTLPEINDFVFGNFATKVESSFVYQIKKTNVELMNLSRNLNNLFICDISSLTTLLGYTFSFDPKMYVKADLVYSLDFLPYIGKYLTDIIQASRGIIKKCLILDLDNTTWGGIIGDDGLEGIQVGGLGIGKAFSQFQDWVKQLKNRGIILAICSKNSENIAKEPFESHPDMVLNLDDIAVFIANWDNKPDNIMHIQSILNIGFDSIVFVDDNPYERGIVKQAIPQITVPDLPDDPSEYLSFLRNLNLFETSTYTQEDVLRSSKYKEEANRAIFKKSFQEEVDFLKSIKMISEVKFIDKFSIPRVAQLSQRSNQFNLRTERYSEEDISKMSVSKDYFTLSYTLKDDFGDYGLISAVILKKNTNGILFIDTWIMSCRVLKRGVESFILNSIVNIATQNGFNTISGEYIPTKKNELVKNLYLELGFSFKNDKWYLDTTNYTIKENYIN